MMMNGRRHNRLVSNELSEKRAYLAAVLLIGGGFPSVSVLRMEEGRYRVIVSDLIGRTCDEIPPTVRGDF